MLAIGVLFGVLSASAATGFPSAQLDYMPRGARMLEWIVTTFGTGPFGASGGAVFFAALGVFLIGLVFVKPRSLAKASDRPQRSKRSGNAETDAASTLLPPTPRRRTISARTVEDGYAAYDPPPLPPIAAQDVSGPQPAWGLMLASPWTPAEAFTSWLGGLPCAPAGFDWPRDADDGEPMHFFAQIDLAALAPEPATGARAPGLPQAGAMLVFIGHGCAVRIFDTDDMAAAQPVPPPGDLPSLRKFGYWEDGNVFPAWPIVPAAFLDQPYDEENWDGDPPAAFPNPHRDPADWLTNWGMAALEAGMLITTLQAEIRNAQWSFDFQLRKLSEGDEAEAESGDTLHVQVMGALNSYQNLLLTEAPALLAELEGWKRLAEARDPMQPIDPDALARHLEQRRAFCAKEERSFSGTIALRGAAHRVWEAMRSGAGSGDPPFVALRDLPSAYRRFAEERITGWRRHRLFGIEPPFSNNWEDLRGKACLISIGADQLLRTETEHEYGISLWGPVENLEQGRYDRLEVVRHCAV